MNKLAQVFANGLGRLIPRRATDFSAALQQVTSGNATGFPAGSPFGPSGFVVNCPVVSLNVNVSG